MGLAGKALEVLRESDISMFGADGMKLEVDLFIKTGRCKEVREWLTPEHIPALGEAVYHWNRTMALAATGDYLLAEEECAELDKGDPGVEPKSRVPRMAQSVGKVLLDSHPGIGTLPYAFWRGFLNLEFRNRVAPLATGMMRAADVLVLRGLLRLEQGRVDDAEDDFRLALETWKDKSQAASGATLDFNGRTTAQEYLELLSRKTEVRK
jgi:hypothetical protein